MNEHIDRKDIIGLVFSDKSKPIDVSKIARINQHLMRCDSCRTFYEEVLSLEEQMQPDESEDFMPSLLMRLYCAKKDLKLVSKIITGMKQDFTVSILSNDKVEVWKNALGFGFTHPKYQKAIIEKALREHPEEVKEINESILKTQDNSLFLCLDEDMTFSVYLPKEKSKQNDYVVLADTDSEIVYVSQLKEYNEEKNVAQFLNIEKGEYQLFSTVNDK